MEKQDNKEEDKKVDVKVLDKFQSFGEQMSSKIVAALLLSPWLWLYFRVHQQLALRKRQSMAVAHRLQTFHGLPQVPTPQQCYRGRFHERFPE